MSHSSDSFKRLKTLYSGLEGDDKILFWVHFTVAPAFMIGSVAYICGWGPTIVFGLGFLLWQGSKA